MFIIRCLGNIFIPLLLSLILASSKIVFSENINNIENSIDRENQKNKTNPSASVYNDIDDNDENRDLQTPDKVGVYQNQNIETDDDNDAKYEVNDLSINLSVPPAN